jgi:hypothetical protein
MSGIYYALSIVAVFVIIHWFITNDKKRPDEPTEGLLAMKETSAKPSNESENAPEPRRARFP